MNKKKSKSISSTILESGFTNCGSSLFSELEPDEKKFIKGIFSKENIENISSVKFNVIDCGNCRVRGFGSFHYTNTHICNIINSDALYLQSHNGNNMVSDTTVENIVRTIFMTAMLYLWNKEKTCDFDCLQAIKKCILLAKKLLINKEEYNMKYSDLINLYPKLTAHFKYICDDSPCQQDTLIIDEFNRKKNNINTGISASLGRVASSFGRTIFGDPKNVQLEFKIPTPIWQKDNQSIASGSPLNSPISSPYNNNGSPSNNTRLQMRKRRASSLSENTGSPYSNPSSIDSYATAPGSNTSMLHQLNSFDLNLSPGEYRTPLGSPAHIVVSEDKNNTTQFVVDNIDEAPNRKRRIVTSINAIKNFDTASVNSDFSSTTLVNTDYLDSPRNSATKKLELNQIDETEYLMVEKKHNTCSYFSYVFINDLIEEKERESIAYKLFETQTIQPRRNGGRSDVRREEDLIFIRQSKKEYIGVIREDNLGRYVLFLTQIPYTQDGLFHAKDQKREVNAAVVKARKEAKKVDIDCITNAITAFESKEIANTPITKEQRKLKEKERRSLMFAEEQQCQQYESSDSEYESDSEKGACAPKVLDRNYTVTKPDKDVIIIDSDNEEEQKKYIKNKQQEYNKRHMILRMLKTKECKKDICSEKEENYNINSSKNSPKNEDVSTKYIGKIAHQSGRKRIYEDSDSEDSSKEETTNKKRVGKIAHYSIGKRLYENDDYEQSDDETKGYNARERETNRREPSKKEGGKFF